MNPVVVFRAFDPAQAHLICSVLQSSGLQAEVTQELSSINLEGYSMASGGIRVVVPAEQVLEARAIIESTGAGDTSAGEERQG